MKNTNHNPIEPGLFSLFRLFTAFTLVFMLLSMVVQTATDRSGTDTKPIVLCGATFFLLIAPKLNRRYPHVVLATALVLFTASGLMLQVTSNPDIDPILTEDFVSLRILGTMLWLILPVLVIAWHYRLKHVLAFLVLTHFGSMALLVYEYGREFVQGGMILSVLGFRTVALFIAGTLTIRLVASQREQHRALTEANTKLGYYAATLDRLATTRERNRLARELHDTLAHTLSAVAIQLEAVDALWKSSPEQAHERLTRSIAETRSGLAETRRVLEDLRASPLEDLGLALAVRTLATTMARRAGIQVDLQIQGEFTSLSPAVEQAVYRIAQEAFANIDRHAHASHVTVRMSYFSPDLVLRISDDGAGFEESQLNLQDRYGIRGMQERADMIGGKLSLESDHGEGTTLMLTVKVLL